MAKNTFVAEVTFNGNMRIGTYLDETQAIMQ